MPQSLPPNDNGRAVKSPSVSGSLSFQRQEAGLPEGSGWNLRSMTLSKLMSLSGLHFTCQVGGSGQMSSRLPPALPLQGEGWCGRGAAGVLTHLCYLPAGSLGLSSRLYQEGNWSAYLTPHLAPKGPVRSPSSVFSP